MQLEPSGIRYRTPLSVVLWNLLDGHGRMVVAREDYGDIIKSLARHIAKHTGRVVDTEGVRNAVDKLHHDGKLIKIKNGPGLRYLVGIQAVGYAGGTREETILRRDGAVWVHPRPKPKGSRRPVTRRVSSQPAARRTPSGTRLQAV